MLTIILYSLFILACVVLIVAVLLQPGKADAGALFTSSVSTTAFGPRGTQSVLAKITIGAAAAFMIGALVLSAGLDRPRSVMEGATPEATPTPAATAQPEASPAATAQEGAPAPAASPEAAASPAASPAAQPSGEQK